jgi:hypothetical protein
LRLQFRFAVHGFWSRELWTLAVKKKRVIIAAGILTVLVMAGVFVAKCTDPYGLQGTPRREWKDRALTKITRRSNDSTWLASEIATLKAKATKDQTDSDGWLSPHLILMTNGEWIVYANVCRKEDRHIHDLFLGRASDGKWYYSTFHFCIQMLVLKMGMIEEGGPGSVAKFAETYYLRAFDGHSDDCLHMTWPPKRK